MRRAIPGGRREAMGMRSSSAPRPPDVRSANGREDWPRAAPARRLRSRSSALIPAILTALAIGAGCQDDAARLATVEEPPDAGCIRTEEPQTYEVYFVIDVSGSMGPFLNDLRDELVAFADGFARLDDQGRPVRVDYYVVAFVNDVKRFGGRMTSVIALQAAFEEAIARGQTNMNLMQNRFNAEPEENLLDALADVIAGNPSAEANLILVANDAPFLESPSILSDRIEVRSNYASIRADLERVGARVHAFVPDQLDGLSRTYQGQPALTSLPGSTVHSLRDLTGANSEIRSTLSFIAREAACN